MNFVREAAEQDLPQLPAIEASADRLYAEAGHPTFPCSTVDDLKKARLIVVIGQPVAGFARIDEIEGCAHLEQLSVDRAHSGQGLGRELLEGACNHASQLGYSALTLITFKNFRWNAPFYAKNGFRELPIIPEHLQSLWDHETQIGLDAIDQRVVMERTLT